MTNSKQGFGVGAVIVIIALIIIIGAYLYYGKKPAEVVEPVETTATTETAVVETPAAETPAAETPAAQE